MESGPAHKFILFASATVGFLALCSGLAHAQRSAGAGTHTLTPSQPAQTASADPAPARAPAKVAPAPAPQKITLADFAWLEGRWQGSWGPRTAEQTWSSPTAGMMLGTFRLVENEKTLVIEMFTLVDKPDGINLYIRHFTPDLVPWEKSDATLLNLIGLDGPRAIFANPVNGQPRRSIFVHSDADIFVSRSEIETEAGETQAVEITYHRQKPAAAAPANAGSASRP